MQVIDAPKQSPSSPEDPADEPSPSQEEPRFRSWRGFLFAAIAVNVLFAYGMLNNTADPSVAIWFKVLVWLPFNAIATALYIVFMIKLGTANAANNQTGGAFYTLLSGFMLVANWITLIAA
jgi:hypothetical protein